MRRRARRRSIGLPTRSSAPSSPARAPIWRFSPRSAAPTEFRAGTFDTGFIDRNLGDCSPAAASTARRRRSARAQLLAQDAARIAQNLDRAPDAPASPWDATDGFQLSGAARSTLPILVDGEPAEAHVDLWRRRRRRLLWMARRPALDATAIEAADAVYVLRHGRQTVVRRADWAAGDLDHADGDGAIRAPMHGKVLALLVAKGEQVEKGQRLGHHRGDEDGARA